MIELKIEHHGSRFTDTIFKKYNGTQFKIRVFFDSVVSVSLNMTYYRYILYTKNKGCRNWVNLIDSGSVSYQIEKAKEYGIDEKTLYRAYYNHWNKLNPFRQFRTGQINSDLTFPDNLEQLIAATEHKAY